VSSSLCFHGNRRFMEFCFTNTGPAVIFWLVDMIEFALFIESGFHCTPWLSFDVHEPEFVRLPLKMGSDTCLALESWKHDRQFCKHRFVFRKMGIGVLKEVYLGWTAIYRLSKVSGIPPGRIPLELTRRLLKVPLKSSLMVNSSRGRKRIQSSQKTVNQRPIWLWDLVLLSLPQRFHAKSNNSIICWWFR
jgi:hypothetical protein